MKKRSLGNWNIIVLAIAVFGCNDPSSTKQFEITGKIVNSTATKVYLEELASGANQSIAVDSFALGKDGNYTLKTDAKESMIYNLRLDKSRYPVASVINDVPKMTLNITLQPESNEFAEKYDVSSSKASQQMKDFMYGFNDKLQEIYPLAVRADSLRRVGAPDSAFDDIRAEWKIRAGKIKDFTMESIAKTENPALYIFELGFYRGSAQQQSFGLEPIELEEEIKLLNDGIAKFPDHEGMKAVRTLREEEWKQLAEMNKEKWVGKPAPDFTLPDPDGNLVKLSSFRGKYVLVDFWASWCVPCRAENPNVVKVFNKFKDKNFAILGVSLDNPGEKSEWLAAIKKDNLTWTHVSDLKGWESIVVPMYDFGQVGIPYNILVNPEGIVVAERLKGTRLDAKLAEVLK